MEIYFQEIYTRQTLELPVTESQDSYQLNIPPGVYVAFAWMPNQETGGGYTEFLRCNQNISSCDDHSLVPFLVRENHVTTDVLICDWETDYIIFPMLPEE